MRRRRILLSTLGSLGDLHPDHGARTGLAGARPRCRARHERFLPGADHCRGAGIQAFAAAWAHRTTPRPCGGFSIRAKDRNICCARCSCRISREMYSDLSQAAEGADLLISGEVVLAASLVSEKLGLPWAGAILAPFSFFSVYDPPPFPFLAGGRPLHARPSVHTASAARVWAPRDP